MLYLGADPVGPYIGPPVLRDMFGKAYGPAGELLQPAGTPGARSTPYTKKQWEDFQKSRAAGQRAKNPATCQWEGEPSSMSIVSFMDTGAYGGAAGGRSYPRGTALPDPTAAYGEEVSLSAGVMPLQDIYAQRELSREFQMLQQQQAAPLVGGSSVSAQAAMPVYGPGVAPEIAREEAQAPLPPVMAVSVPGEAPKTGIDTKWLIAAGVLGIFLAMRK